MNVPPTISIAVLRSSEVVATSSGVSVSSFQIVLRPMMWALGAASRISCTVVRVCARTSSGSSPKSLLDDCTMTTSGCRAASAGTSPE